MKKRREFALRMLKNPDKALKNIFSDEKLFRNSPNNKVKLIKRKKGEGYIDKNIFKESKPSQTCMIWLYIGPFGKGDIFLAENNKFFNEDGDKIKQIDDSCIQGFDNLSYTALVDKKAIPSINRRMIDWIFVQDNSRVHTSLKHTGNTIYDIFRSHNVEYVDDWPANSPDLHPVENAHHLLQIEVNKELNKLIRIPKNKREMFALIKMCWYQKVDNEKLVKIYHSFLDRCRLCLFHEGNNNFSTKTTSRVNKEILKNFNLSHYE
jgi:hypothetical protein